MTPLSTLRGAGALCSLSGVQGLLCSEPGTRRPVWRGVRCFGVCRDPRCGCDLVSQACTRVTGASPWGSVVSGHQSLSPQWLGRLQELASLTAGNMDCLCPCLSSLPLSFRSLSLFSSGLRFPTGSHLGLVSQVLSLAQPKTRHMTHARPVRLSSESLNPKENN